MATCSIKLMTLVLVLELVAIWPGMYQWCSDAKLQFNSPTGILIGIILFLSPAYTILMFPFLNKIERQGGFFMYYKDSYECLMSTVWTLVALWLIAFFLSLIFFWKYFLSFGLFLLLDALGTSIVPMSLWWQKCRYQKNTSKTLQANLEEGQELTDNEAHTIYQMQVHEHKVDHPEDTPISRGEKLDDGRSKAIQANNYFKMQQWMHELEKASANNESCPQMAKIYNAIAQQCETFDELSTPERQHIRQLAKMECLVVPEPNFQIPLEDQIRNSRLRRQQNRTAFHLGKSHHQMVLQKLGENHRPSSAQSYLDLRRDSEAPPSYKSYEIGDGRRASFL